MPNASSIARIGDLIDHHAAEQPGAAALLATGLPACFYRDLARQGREVARLLSQAGIDRGDRVAVAMPNGPELAAAFLAIAAHAACAPLNPEFREAELDFFLLDLQARAVVVPATGAEAARLSARRLGITILELEVPGDRRAGEFRLRHDSRHGVGVGAGPSRPHTHHPDIALLLHTSGTTARPKLVPLTHANLLCSAGNITSTLALTPADRCLNVMPLFHIHGLVGALLSSMAAGASIICSRGLEPDSFVAELRRLDATWYTAVPAMHQAILERVRQLPRAARSCALLRLVRSSSAALPAPVLRELEACFGVPVIESYGMTEAAHQMASNPLPPRPRKAHSVGLAAGPEIAVMSADGGHVPRGGEGEIVIRGANVTTGYEGNHDATAAAFVQGWFRTGDAGRIDQDGYLFLTGRIKEQINRGGEKLAPVEVDEALLEHAAVAQAVTFAVPHPRLGEDVASAVVLRAGATATEDDLRQFLFARLSPAKVPSQVVFVVDLPKGATGKLQRLGLHHQLGHLLRPDFVTPRTPTERRLARLWCHVLGTGEIGALDNFFAVGGDSLMAGRLIARLHEELAVTISPAEVFGAPTLAAQAALIDDLTGP